MAYPRYRGQKRAGRGLKYLIIILLIILIVLAVSFFYLQRYMVYTDEGAYLDLPFLKNTGNTPPSSPPASPAITLEIVPPTQALPESTPYETTPARSPDVTLKAVTLKAVYIPAADILNPSRVNEYIELCKDTALNAVIIEMKSESGALSYKSNVQTAIDSGASGTANISEAVKKFKDADIYLCAYVSCFKDNIAPRKVQNLSVKVQSGVIWLDAKMTGWLNPYSDEAQKYITDLCSELARMGFDEIVLDHVTFPTVGKLSLISYGSSSSIPKTSCINGFADKLSKALSKDGVSLSVILSQKTVVDGFYADAGQDFAELADTAYRIYVPVDSARASVEYADIRESVLALLPEPGDEKERLVPIITPAVSYTAPAETLMITLDAAGGNDGLGYFVKSNAESYATVKAAFR